MRFIDGKVGDINRSDVISHPRQVNAVAAFTIGGAGFHPRGGKRAMAADEVVCLCAKKIITRW